MATWKADLDLVAEHRQPMYEGMILEKVQKERLVWEAVTGVHVSQMC